MLKLMFNTVVVTCTVIATLVIIPIVVALVSGIGITGLLAFLAL